MNNTKVIAVIQARLGSTRLRDKVLMEINGKTIIKIIHERLLRSTLVDGIVLAIPDNASQERLREEGARIGIPVVAGPELDIATRLLNTAGAYKDVDAMVRVTADCPFVDPNLVDHLIGIFKEDPEYWDYCCNYVPRTFPDGFDLDLFSVRALYMVIKAIPIPEEREHTPRYIHAHFDKFNAYTLEADRDYSKMRVTLDYPEDFELIGRVYQSLVTINPSFGWEEVASFLEDHPEIMELNAKYT